jgi:hypothetical protein
MTRLTDANAVWHSACVVAWQAALGHRDDFSLREGLAGANRRGASSPRSEPERAI